MKRIMTCLICLSILLYSIPSFSDGPFIWGELLTSAKLNTILNNKLDTIVYQNYIGSNTISLGLTNQFYSWDKTWRQIPYSMISGTPILGSLASLNSLDYSLLTGAPTLFNGNYPDLTNLPTIPTALSDLTGDFNHRLSSDAEKALWNGKQDSTLYDVTTNNVSILMHGYVPKAPNDVTMFLNGLGLYSVPVVPLNLSDLTDDSTHRLTNDTEKATWTEKQDALGYTPENITNKTATIDSSTTTYPQTGAIKDYVDIGLISKAPIASPTFTGLVTAVQYSLSSLNTDPATSTDACTIGEIRISSTYIYVCIATDSWVRSALTTW
jgi:hypothetical protein